MEGSVTIGQLFPHQCVEVVSANELTLEIVEVARRCGVLSLGHLFEVELRVRLDDGGEPRRERHPARRSGAGVRNVRTEEGRERSFQALHEHGEGSLEPFCGDRDSF